jgi:hypothetical protein
VSWTERDGQLLRFVGEQYAITVPQLARLLCCSERNVRLLRQRWLHAGWVHSRPLGWRGPAFLWLSGPGIRACASPYRSWRPNAALAAHIEAVTDVRLLLDHELRLGRWCCERTLAQASPSRSLRRPHLPDAILERHHEPIAIEVELTLKSRARLQAIVEELAASYPHVWYFASPSILPALDELAADSPWGNVHVHPYPADPRTLAT